MSGHESRLRFAAEVTSSFTTRVMADGMAFEY